MYMYIILISHLMKLDQDINAVQPLLSKTRLSHSYNFNIPKHRSPCTCIIMIWTVNLQ